MQRHDRVSGTLREKRWTGLVIGFGYFPARGQVVGIVRLDEPLPFWSDPVNEILVPVNYNGRHRERADDSRL